MPRSSRLPLPSTFSTSTPWKRRPAVRCEANTPSPVPAGSARCHPRTRSSSPPLPTTPSTNGLSASVTHTPSGYWPRLLVWASLSSCSHSSTPHSPPTLASWTASTGCGRSACPFCSDRGSGNHTPPAPAVPASTAFRGTLRLTKPTSYEPPEVKAALGSEASAVDRQRRPRRRHRFSLVEVRDERAGDHRRG